MLAEVASIAVEKREEEEGNVEKNTHLKHTGRVTQKRSNRFCIDTCR